AVEGVVHGDRARADVSVPLAASARRLGLGEHEVEDPVEQVVLVRDVVVERHRLETEELAELPHRHRLDAVLVRELERGAQDAVAAEGEAGLGFGGHLTELTPYVYLTP